MTEFTPLIGIAYPESFSFLFLKKIDLEASFSALSGYNHFYSETLRGKIRSLQLKPEEAAIYFEKARKLSQNLELTPQNLNYIFILRTFALDNAVLLEAKRSQGESTELLDREMELFLSFDLPENDITLAQIQMNAIGYYQLLKKEYSASLLTFETLLSESKARFEDMQCNFYCGAAAAAKELGYEEIAARHYENAALGVNTISLPLNIGLFSARLYALLTYWERPQEAELWLERLKMLSCPEASRECFIQRAQLFTAASAAREHIFIA